jgi:hypothetical protein
MATAVGIKFVIGVDSGTESECCSTHYIMCTPFFDLFQKWQST